MNNILSSSQKLPGSAGGTARADAVVMVARKGLGSGDEVFALYGAADGEAKAGELKVLKIVGVEVAQDRDLDGVDTAEEMLECWRHGGYW